MAEVFGAQRFAAEAAKFEPSHPLARHGGLVKNIKEAHLYCVESL